MVLDFLADAEATHVAVEVLALLSGLDVGIFGREKQSSFWFGSYPRSGAS